MDNEVLDRFEDRNKVQRIGLDHPITLILPIGKPTFYGSFPVAEQAFQVDIFYEGNRTVPEVYAQFVQSGQSEAILMTHVQIRNMAQAAFVDLGIVHPGVADLLNFSQHQNT